MGGHFSMLQETYKSLQRYISIQLAEEQAFYLLVW